VKISPSNLIFHEIIGLNVQIQDSSNKYNIGIDGRVVDETQNTVVIETDKGEKRIQKKGTKFVFQIHYNSIPKKVQVEGNLLHSQPENRIKNIMKIRMR